MSGPGYAIGYVRSKNVSETTVGDERIIVNLENDDFFSVSGASAIIWTCIEQLSTVDEIVEKLCLEYPDIPREILEDDCVSFLNDLVDNGLADDCGRK